MSWAIEEKGYSQRRARTLVGLAPKVYRYLRCSDDGVLRTRLRALAAQRRRFGYRRLHLLLRREGFAVNHKKLFRISSPVDDSERASHNEKELRCQVVFVKTWACYGQILFSSWERYPHQRWGNSLKAA